MAIHEMVAYDPKVNKLSKKQEAALKKQSDKEWKQMQSGTYARYRGNSFLDSVRKTIDNAIGTTKNLNKYYQSLPAKRDYASGNYEFPSIDNSNNANNNNSNRDASEEAYLRSLQGTGGGYASGIDLANILDTYTQSANAQKQTISDSSASQRQGLLDSLKRFQSETDEARNRQRRAYNASRADLEGQAFMSSRQAARSAAARGLGGSGLQQLAQLQALMNQEDAVNQLAQSNTDTLKAIATAAQNKEEDTNKALQTLDKETANKLAQIDANTANLQAQLQYNEAVRLEDAKARAAAASASGNSALAQYNLYKLQQEDERQALDDAAKNTLANILAAGTNALDTAYTTNQKNTSKANSKETNKAINNAAALYAQMLLENANTAGVDIAPYLNQFNERANYYRNRNKK